MKTIPLSYKLCKASVKMPTRQRPLTRLFANKRFTELRFRNFHDLFSENDFTLPSTLSNLTTLEIALGFGNELYEEYQVPIFETLLGGSVPCQLEKLVLRCPGNLCKDYLESVQKVIKDKVQSTTANTHGSNSSTSPSSSDESDDEDRCLNVVLKCPDAEVIEMTIGRTTGLVLSMAFNDAVAKEKNVKWSEILSSPLTQDLPSMRVDNAIVQSAWFENLNAWFGALPSQNSSLRPLVLDCSGLKDMNQVTKLTSWLNKARGSLIKVALRNLQLMNLEMSLPKHKNHQAVAMARPPYNPSVSMANQTRLPVSRWPIILQALNWKILKSLDLRNANFAAPQIDWIAKFLKDTATAREPRYKTKKFRLTLTITLENETRIRSLKKETDEGVLSYVELKILDL
ncbi:hypothetical protein BGZ83_009298 [Gryganskiella cystojenkinii]|nr:hypothetical protein BGZ83_009298 [Gryganskiella cystojenkinii]